MRQATHVAVLQFCSLQSGGSRGWSRWFSINKVAAMASAAALRPRALRCTTVTPHSCLYSRKQQLARCVCVGWPHPVLVVKCVHLYAYGGRCSDSAPPLRQPSRPCCHFASRPVTTRPGVPTPQQRGGQPALRRSFSSVSQQRVLLPDCTAFPFNRSASHHAREKSLHSAKLILF